MNLFESAKDRTSNKKKIKSVRVGGRRTTKNW